MKTPVVTCALLLLSVAPFSVAVSPLAASVTTTVPLPTGTAASVPPTTIVNKRSSSLTIVLKKSKFDRFLEKLFDDADTNRDGSIAFAEVYELVLKMYIKINNQAPIPPPSRKKVLQLYLDADTSNDDRLTKDEFKGLAKTLGRRALSRLVAHKLVTLVGAPILAEYLVRTLAGKEWLPRMAEGLVPKRFHERLLPAIKSRVFCRTVLIVVLVETLGNIVIFIVNWVLDMSMPDEDEDPRLKKHVKD
jgi:hypothetical protein